MFANKTSGCNSGEGFAKHGGRDPLRTRRSRKAPTSTVRSSRKDVNDQPVGNFYTATKFTAPMIARVCETTGPDCKGTAKRVQTMIQKVGQDPATGATVRVDCNLCHYAGGQALTRIYLPSPRPSPGLQPFEPRFAPPLSLQTS